MASSEATITVRFADYETVELVRRMVAELARCYRDLDEVGRLARGTDPVPYPRDEGLLDSSL